MSKNVNNDVSKDSPIHAGHGNGNTRFESLFSPEFLRAFSLLLK